MIDDVMSPRATSAAAEFPGASQTGSPDGGQSPFAPKTAPNRDNSRPFCDSPEFPRAVRSGTYSWLKSFLDFTFSGTLLILTAPLVAILLVAVPLASPGPAIYTQVRLGRGGRSFPIFKLRTMRHNCERHTGPCWSLPGDPRVTPLGRILRHWHLDELPQLWNVLRGEMSLVGPRPERPEIAAQLALALPAYAVRVMVQPGITGLAQVLLPPDEDLASVRRKLTCDLYYMEQGGLWLDIRVLLATGLKLVGVSPARRRRLLRLPSEEHMIHFLTARSLRRPWTSAEIPGAGVHRFEPAGNDDAPECALSDSRLLAFLVPSSKDI